MNTTGAPRYGAVDDARSGTDAAPGDSKAKLELLSAADDDEQHLLPAVWLVSTLSLPAMLSYGVESLGQTITLGFVGHYFQEQEIGAVIVAICFLYMFLLFPGIGALFAMDTLVARYYGNDPTTDRIGEVLQRALCINVIYTAVVAIVVWTVVPSCVSFLAHPELAPLTSLWLMYCPIYILGTLTSRALTKYFINQHLTQYPPVAAAIGQVSSVLLHMWLVPKLGLVGSALAFGLCTFVQAFVLAIVGSLKVSI